MNFWVINFEGQKDVGRQLNLIISFILDTTIQFITSNSMRKTSYLSFFSRFGVEAIIICKKNQAITCLFSTSILLQINDNTITVIFK